MTASNNTGQRQGATLIRAPDAQPGGTASNDCAYVTDPINNSGLPCLGYVGSLLPRDAATSLVAAPRTLRQSQESFRMFRRVVIGAMVLVTLTACDKPDPRITALVTSASPGSVCIEPTDSHTWSRLAGCYPFDGARQPDLPVGVCITARVPTNASGARHDKPLSETRIVGKSC
jgi:hypothetical protein